MTLNRTPSSPSIENNRVSPDAVADLFESIASSNNGLLELRCAAQTQVLVKDKDEDIDKDKDKDSLFDLRFAAQTQVAPCSNDPPA